jgi:hypothetical protein
MAGFKRDDSKSTKYFSNGKAAQKQDKPNVSNLVETLRSDMVPASDVVPAKESVLHRETLRIAVGIVLGVIILSFLFYILIGPGRPILEHNLAILAHQTSTPSQIVTQTPIPPTKSPFSPTNTPYPPSPTPTLTSTVSPTNTPVVQMLASPTYLSPTPSPTVVNCRDALSITLADVGQTLCVQGVVIETISNPTNFMVIFSNKRSSFYWVSYDVVWSKAKLKTCYQTIGKIEQIGNAPLLVFNFKNLPKVCP